LPEPGITYPMAQQSQQLYNGDLNGER
jgi:hypothetical protein